MNERVKRLKGGGCLSPDRPNRGFAGAHGLLLCAVFRRVSESYNGRKISASFIVCVSLATFS